MVGFTNTRQNRMGLLHVPFKRPHSLQSELLESPSDPTSLVQNLLFSLRISTVFQRIPQLNYPIMQFVRRLKPLPVISSPLVPTITGTRH